MSYEYKSKQEIYEEEIKPALEDLDRDPFRSLDLEDQLDYSSSFIGRVLSHASKSEEYDIDRIRYDHTSFYTVEERDVEDIKYPVPPEDREILETVLDELENGADPDNQMTESELHQTVSQELSSNTSLNVKVSKTGEIKDYLREIEGVEYDPEESAFRLEV